MIVFGPVPSRRLGRSVGINNIPPKLCSYSCVYCQIGRTLKMQINREAYYDVEYIVKEVKNKIAELKERGEKIDYLTFVPDGEPTLDINIGKEIEVLKPLGLKIAVISNSSLIWREDVRNDLSKADWVSLKIDAVTEEVWHKIDRSDRKLCHNDILNGMLHFSKNYTGFFVTETMLVEGINDDKYELEKIAEFLAKLNPRKAYISVPTRPPAEKVFPPGEQKINIAYQIFREKGITPEYLIGYEGNEFSSTGNFEEDLLNITAVHPMKKPAVEKLLQKCNCDWSIVKKMLKEEKITEVEYQSETFYMRKLYVPQNSGEK
ncbi:radical SAM protein [Thermoanaerobacter uzonensis]|uniref:radical SAM protein n=1 Tax=Thermoanaerobacter uzonensis TaxID=447593 RepID=UPI003D767E3F